MKKRLLASGAFAACVLLCAPAANAATYQVGQYLGNLNDAGRFAYSTMGGAAQYANYGASGPAFTSTANGIRIAGQATATIGGRAVPLTLISRLPIASVIGGARALAMANPGTAAITLLGFAAMQGWLTPAGLQWNPDPTTNIEKPFVEVVQPQCDQAGCKYPEYDAAYGNAGWASSMPAACTAALSYFSRFKNHPQDTCVQSGCSSQGFAYYCTGPGGSYGSGSPMSVRYVTVGGDPPRRPLTWDEATPYLSGSGQDFSGADWKGIAQGLLQRGASFPQPVDQTVSGPASQQGERTTRQNADGTTTTTTTTHNYSYNAGNTTNNTTTNITHNTTTITTTTNANGDPVSEETETTEPEPEEPENATDTPLAAVPDFYEQKYPDGFTGVWAARKGELQGSTLSQIAASLMPVQIGSGSCPQITIPLNVGLRDFGVRDISVPCSVWVFGKWVIIISALLLCRRLVFGG